MAFVSGLTTHVQAAQAGTLTLTSCSGFSDGGTDGDAIGPVWQGVDTAHLSASNHCAEGGSFQILPSGYPNTGETAQWITVTPPSIEITHAVTPVNEVLIDPNIGADGYSASFVWGGGSQQINPINNCCGGMDYGSGINRSLGPSRWFGWQASCVSAPCGAPFQILDVRGIQLDAVDTTPPALLALGSNNIWYQSGRWVRGSWPASWAASADAGICGMQAIIGGQSIAGPSDPSPNQHSWTQCPTPVTMNMSVDTTRYANGAMPLTLSAADAASPANVSSPSETLNVDNEPVSLALSGPTDAPSTSGTQYVDAYTSAGPSGVAGISCSVDGAPYQWHAGSAAQIPVQGVGQHQVVCYAQNRAVDSAGNPATSPSQTWTLSIRVPTESGISFAHVVDALRCHRVRERIKAPAHWVTVHRHHKLVQVRKRARTRFVKATRCDPRTARRKVVVWATVKRHGKNVLVKRKKLERVVLLPHVIQRTVRRVAYGRSTTVGGWLGTYDGTALAAQQVWVMTAPDNGQGKFGLARAVTTGADGSWSATLPPGSSRLVEAVYPGSSTTEPATSQSVRVIVPAVVRLYIKPRAVSWGGTLRIYGRVLGGYIPGNRQQLLRLRIGAEGIFSTVGIPDIAPNGQFHTTWRFHPGVGVVNYWFSVSTLNEADYPFAPASSPHVTLTVGPGSR
jgi:hypothetical protein